MSAEEDQAAAEAVALKLSDGASGNWSVYSAHLSMGFTPDQAMEILLTYIKMSMGQQS